MKANFRRVRLQIGLSIRFTSILAIWRSGGGTNRASARKLEFWDKFSLHDAIYPYLERRHFPNETEFSYLSSARRGCGALFSPP